MDISGSHVYDDNYWKRWVSAISGNTITVTDATGGAALKPDTWALLYVKYGAVNTVGLYDFVYITAVENNTMLTLLRPSINVTSAMLGTGTSVVLYQCINDKQVNIADGSVVTTLPHAGGNVGGVVPIICDELNLDGVIDVSGKGYRGGLAATALSLVGMRGEYYAGGWNSRSLTQQGNGGGGGRNNFSDGYITGTPGGGGANAAAGSSGSSGGTGGTAYSALSMYRAPFGGGGGAGGSDNNYPTSGKGGNGGGAIIILTKQMHVGANGKLLANGEKGADAGNQSGAGAGGAGGTIVVIMETGDTPPMEVIGGIRASNTGYPGKTYYSGAGSAGKTYTTKLRAMTGVYNSSLLMDGVSVSPATIQGDDILITGKATDYLGAPIRYQVVRNDAVGDWTAYYPSGYELDTFIEYEASKYTLGTSNWVEVHAETIDGRYGVLYTQITVLNDLPVVAFTEQGLLVRAVVTNNDKVKIRVLVNGIQEYPYIGRFPQDIIMDNDTSDGYSKTGTWVNSTGGTGVSAYSGKTYDYATANSGAAASYSPEIPVYGQYKVYAMWASHTNRSSLTPIDINFVGGLETIVVNQQANGGVWNLLGTYTFDAGTTGNVKIRTEGANGNVIADAIRFEFVPPFSEERETPVVWEKQYLSTQVNIDGINTVVVIAEDAFGEQNTSTFTFIGKYAGLMFSDLEGNYYSDDFGNVLRYLDVGIIIAGQTTPAYPILLTNKSSWNLQNVLLFKNNKTLPSGTRLEISKTDNPFEPEDELLFPAMITCGDALTFFVRLVSEGTSQTGAGEFDVLTKADPA